MFRFLNRNLTFNRSLPSVTVILCRPLNHNLTPNHNLTLNRNHPSAPEISYQESLEKMSLRTLLIYLAVGLFIGVVALSLPASAAATRQPNILFIFSDDHAYQAISAYGDPRQLNQTPNIDRLAREGMIFHRALVPNSICGPSRACVLTGKYSHMNGFYDNTRCRFDGSQQTMPKLLHKAGYQTAMVGKWHLVSDPTGFDYWEILPGQGIYYNPPMIRMGEKVKTDGYVTDIITDLSLDWLKKRDKSKPFLLMCQHKAPHREWSPNLKYLKQNTRKT